MTYVPKSKEENEVRSNLKAYLTTHVLHSHAPAQGTLDVLADKNVAQIRICPSEALCHSW